MSLNSQIEWTDATWNPVRGCTKISPGCKHCYAETFAERFRGVKGHPYEQGFDLKLVPPKLTEPFTWRSPKLVFVNSMSDLFQPGVPDAYIQAVCQVMVTAKWHTFQVLTKRSERLQELLSGRLRFAAEQDHIWWGVSVEDRQYGLPRIADLQKTPARVRFLSIEPLLEDLGSFDLSNISWAIVGGESGHGARPMQKRLGNLRPSTGARRQLKNDAAAIGVIARAVASGHCHTVKISGSIHHQIVGGKVTVCFAPKGVERRFRPAPGAVRRHFINHPAAVRRAITDRFVHRFR